MSVAKAFWYVRSCEDRVVVNRETPSNARMACYLTDRGESRRYVGFDTPLQPKYNRTQCCLAKNPLTGLVVP